MGVITAILKLIVSVFKVIFGTSKPRETTVDHPDPQVEVTDGKTKEERLADLGL